MTTENQKLELERESRMARLEENQKNTNEKLDSLIARFDKFVETADSRYAPKWVATIVYFLGGGVLLYLGQKVIDSILK